MNTQIPNPKVKFIASLSDGSTIVEGKNDYAWIDGQKSPWVRLVNYAIKNKLLITSLSLLAPSGAVVTIPPVGKFAKSVAFSGRTEADVPVDYDVSRYIERAIMGHKTPDGKSTIEEVSIEKHYTIASALYKKFKIQVWVDEFDPRNTWVTIKHDN
jgi:hypothetical protein